jgi:hypothetical protein
MPSRGIAVWRAKRRRTAGGIGVPARPGGRRRAAGSVVASRVADIASGCVSGGRRNRPLSKKLPRPSARVSAQPRFWKTLPVPGRAATSCLFPRDAARINGSVRACAVKLYGASSSENRGGDGGVNAGREVVAGFRLGARKYVAAYCRPLVCGPIVAPSLRRFAAAMLQKQWYQDHGKPGKSDDGLD